MQRFSQPENLLPDPSLYNGEAVRKVLARASEIEASRQEVKPSELLNASQIEALGEDIGLSPDAIRRALGETSRGNSTDVSASVATSVGSSLGGRRRSLAAASPLTQEKVKAAYFPTLWYGLICSAVILVLSQLMYSNMIARPLGAALAILMAVVVPMFLAMRSGYVTRRTGVGAVGGGLTTFFVFLMAVTAESIVGPRWGMGFQPVLYFIITLVGAIVGASGAVLRNWWESLPKNSDR